MPKLTVSMLGQKISDLDSEVKYLIQKAKMVKAEQERARRLKEAEEAEAAKKAAKEAAKEKKKAAKEAAEGNQTEAAEEGLEDVVSTEAPGKVNFSFFSFFCGDCFDPALVFKLSWAQIQEDLFAQYR